MIIKNFMDKIVGEIPDDEFFAIQLSMKFFNTEELKGIREGTIGPERWVYSNEIIRRYLEKLRAG